MNIKTAIEILSNSANAGITTFNQDYKDTQRLGIEALKRLKHDRIFTPIRPQALLPGETED